MSTRFRSLPLFWKLLLPFLALIVLVGALGTFLVIRDFAAKAEATLQQDLSRRSLEVGTALHDRELYLLESVNFASNLQGIAQAVSTRNTTATAGLLDSVRALKTDLDLLVITDSKGRGIAEFFGSRPTPRSGTTWISGTFVTTALHEPAGGRASGFLTADGKTMLAIAGPVCSARSGCAPAGVAIAGIVVDDLVAEALTRSVTAQPVSTRDAGVTLLRTDGSMLAAAGLAAPGWELPDGRNLLRTHSVPAGDVVSLYAPFEIGGRRAGTLAVSVPKAPAFAAVRSAGFRVVLIVLAVMIGVVAVGAALSRFILAQVKPLLETSRALGQGDFAARTMVTSDDELGELAHGVNQMAEQLQASYETLESRVAQRTEEVHRLLTERTAFFAAMSHEFRTPLGVILNEADMLAEVGKPVTARYARDAAKTIRVSGDQLLRVINEILDLAQADAGRIEVEIESVEFREVVEELRTTVEGLARGSELKVSIDVPRDLPPVMADRGRLREVLLNLVDNAVKYTPAGGTIIIGAASHNGSVDVTVTDTGIGIPPEVGERIFEPFYRVKGSRPVRGQASSGLGLALAKRFVEAQGGRIDFESKAGTGSSFTFSLARAEPIGRSIKETRPAASKKKAGGTGE